MARRPYADIPGHKRFDADLRELASLAQRLADETRKKAGRAKSDEERQTFAALAAKPD